MSDYQPMRISARLRCGVVSDWTLPIDAVVYFQAMREAYGPQQATQPGTKTGGEALTVSMPFRKEHQVLWYFHSSFAQWVGAVAEGQDHWNKRFDHAESDLIDFGKRRGVINNEAGHFRSYHMPIYYRHALEVRWYAVGRVGDVRRLLGMCTHIGKKVDQGWGRVLEWEVEPWPVDWSVYGPGGRLMRAIPSTDGRGMLTGIRPSYWLPKNQAPCVMPLPAHIEV